MSAEDLWTIVYVSSATASMDAGALEGLMVESRVRNAKVGVTGLLLHWEGNIMQCLEGPSESVQHTFARIARDPRHRSILLVMSEAVEARAFSGWSMAFSQATAPQFASLRAAASPGRTEGESGGGGGVSPPRSLLEQFWRNMTGQGARG